MSNSTLRVIKPLLITPAMLLETNVPESDYAEYSTSTSYALGMRVVVLASHDVWESVVDGNVGNTPGSDKTKWLRVGATNRWKPFDNHHRCAYIRVKKMYINTTTQEYPLFQGAIMQLHPSTIFPTPFVPPEPYVRVQPSAPPEHDSATHAPQETAPLLIEGEWVQQWALVEIEPVPEPVPASISRRQGRLALHRLEKFDAAEAAIEAIEDPAQKRTAQIEYEADTWERANPFLAQLWVHMGGTPDTLDDAFRLAATL